MKLVGVVAVVLPTVAVIALLWWLATQLRVVLRMWRMTKELPGPTAWPLVGNIFDLFFLDTAQTFSWIQKTFREHGPLFRLWLGTKLVIGVGCPNAAQRVLAHPKVVNRDNNFSQALGGLVPDSLFTIKDEHFKHQRKIVDQVFHTKMLESYVPAIGEHSDQFAAILSKESDGRTINIKDKLVTATTTLIVTTVLGVPDFDFEKNDIERLIDGTMEHSYTRVIKPWLLFDWLDPFTSDGRLSAKLRIGLKGSVDNMLTTKKSALASGAKTKSVRTGSGKIVQNLLDMVFDAAAKGVKLLEDSSVRGDMLALVGAGVDTSSIAMARTLLLLGVHPDYQERVFEEQQMIFGDSLRPATLEDMNQMDELENVIKEALRLHPPASFLPREIPEDIEISEGVVLPAGCTAYVFSPNIHRDPKYFAEPNRFWPERWLAENSEGRHPFAYLPFSFGPRFCIGQRYAQITMRILLSRVIRQFRIECHYTMEEMDRTTVGLTFQSVLGYDAQLYPRN